MEPPRRALSDVQLRCRSDPAPPRCRHSTGCWVRTQHLTQHSRGRPYRFLIPRPWNARWYIKMAGGRLPACKKEGFRRARGDSAVQRPSRAKSKTNNTGDSHVVTHRSTNPAITCLYMAERTGCLAFTYLWSFVLDLHVSQLIYLHPPPHTAASSRHVPASGGDPTVHCGRASPEASLAQCQISRRRSAPMPLRSAARGHVPASGGDPAVFRGHAEIHQIHSSNTLASRCGLITFD